jgi:hypothetical protein
MNHLGVGAALKCFYVPFTEYNIFGERVSGGYYSETTATANISYNFLAGYNFKGIATGLNLKGAYRGVPDYADNNTNQVIKNSGLNQSAAAIMADLGFMFQFNVAKFYISREPNLRVGLTLNNVGASFTGLSDNFQLDDPLPTRLAAGISYKPIRPLTIAVEFRQPFNLFTGELFSAWVGAFGIDVAVTTFFSVQSGFLLQGGNPRVSLGGSFAVSSFVINANYTLDLTSTVAPLNRFSLSAKMSLGDNGRSLVRAQVDELYAEGLKEYSAERLDEAIVFWNECLKLDAGFDPAKMGIKAAQNAIFLQQRIIDIQKLD